MREIKFRAWEKTHKRMLDKVLASRYKDGACSLVWFENDWVNFDEHCGELMQYTGLKDKNGKEIYEGDIIKNIRKTYEVFWNDEKTGYYLKIIESDYVLNKGLHFPIWQWVINFVLFDVEVIGNIYENPELIKEVVKNEL